MRLFKFVTLPFLLFFICQELSASHLRAGDIHIERISNNSFRYRITLTIYSERGSAPLGFSELNFGDGQIIEGRDALIAQSVFFEEIIVECDVQRTIIQFEHEYVDAGNYQISYTENSRTTGILNLNNGDSDVVDFHLEGLIRATPFASINASPTLNHSPLDYACIGNRYRHSMAAFDAEGDSIAFRLIPPMSARGQFAEGYQPLDHPDISRRNENGGTLVNFEIDSISGLFTWDAPEFSGRYNIAIVMEEWRYSETSGEMEFLGTTMRDMQIIVIACINERPEVQTATEICVEAGTTINHSIFGTDRNGHQVILEAFGGPLEIANSPAQFTSLDEYSPSPIQAHFFWQTNLMHVRQQPYHLTVKIKDITAPSASPCSSDQTQSLTDFEVISIRVIAPAPSIQSAELTNSNSISIQWEEYVGKDYMPDIEIWRKVGSGPLDKIACEPGIPANSGYVRIGTTSSQNTQFTDNNNLQLGAKYCYRLTATFPLPGSGVSYASEEICIETPAFSSLITNVDVIETSTTNGQINVVWQATRAEDPDLHSGPYTYELRKATGFDLATGGESVVLTQDTSYLDASLNTSRIPYSYQVIVFDKEMNPVDTSLSASSVRLSAFPDDDAVELTWRANVPWTNRSIDHPYHYIYRNRVDLAAQNDTEFKLIDSVNVFQKGQTYRDEGQFNGVRLFPDEEYTYFVATSGSYESPEIVSPLINHSQHYSIILADTLAPAPPDWVVDSDDIVDMLDIDGEDALLVRNQNCERFAERPCDFADYSNNLNWISSDQEEDIIAYKVYYSKNGVKEDFTELTTLSVQEYEHKGLADLKGCYRISAIDRSGNESELSQTLCFDNCPFYILPNTFTPNGDGINDTFRAFDVPNSKCPRFVEAIEVTVYNRYGGDAVFTYDSAEDLEPKLLVDWNGTNDKGQELPAGTYYYSVVVYFDVLDKNSKRREYKNWVNLIR